MSSNPFAPPVDIDRPITTRRGFSLGGCTGLFLLTGVLSAVPGACWVAFRLFSVAIPHGVYVVTGTCFGIGLWIAIDRFVGGLSMPRILVIVAGAMIAFTLGGLIYILMATLNLTRAQLFGPYGTIISYLLPATAANMLLLTAIRISGCIISIRHLAVVWFVGTLLGTLIPTMAKYLSRTGIDRSPADALGLIMFQAALMATIGLALGLCSDSTSLDSAPSDS